MNLFYCKHNPRCEVATVDRLATQACDRGLRSLSASSCWSIWTHVNMELKDTKIYDR